MHISIGNTAMKTPPLTPEEIKRSKLGVPLSKKELNEHKNLLGELARAERKAIAEKAKLAGLKPKQIRDDAGGVNEVYCFPTSYRLMGFEDHQIQAAERFEIDWQIAYRTLKSQGYEPGVDGARNIHGPHLAQVQAQTRLGALRAYVGQRSWEVVTAVVIHGATVRGMLSKARVDNRKIRQEIDIAFNDLHGFYAGERRKDPVWAAFEDFNLERAAMIADAERGSSRLSKKRQTEYPQSKKE